eukprot:NODE_1260_length_1574_cov_0.373559.p1 type:complete len:105 gc:universal NODE_1260_length_1574_cov_0.373559:291-605(+)
MQKNRDFNCHWDTCYYTHSEPCALYEHCTEHLNDGLVEDRFICKWRHCKFTSKRYHGLKSHLILHIPHRPYICEVCDKTFKRKFDLKKHRKTVHYRGIDKKLLD